LICPKCGVDYGIGQFPFCKGGHGVPNVAVIDDELEGGPRRFETMGDDAPYIASKSQWKREIIARNLEHVDKHDRAHYQRAFKQHDERLRDTGAKA
jgi:hypothetical protein